MLDINRTILGLNVLSLTVLTISLKCTTLAWQNTSVSHRLLSFSKIWKQ